MLDGPQSDHPRICPPHVGRHGEAGGDRGGDEGGEDCRFTVNAVLQAF